MVRLSAKCPPGVVCISPTLLGFGILLIAIVAAAWISRSPTGPPVFNVTLPSSEQQPIQQVMMDGGGDDRYTRAPKPEREWKTAPDLSELRNSPYKMPAIATRGVPDSYQSMGILTTSDGQVLPLYGRRTASRSDRFQYYTRTDTYNPIQLPIQHKRRECEDTNGCEELFDGDSVKISATGKEANVKIYRFSGPTYIPAV
jgi:hypothetical protein